MEDLTQRQIDILKVIIKEYTETGAAVGSEILEKKYKLGVSPATIRNEMVELAKKDYLKKTHFSSGRIPSARGFRFYIKHLMKQKEMSTTDEVSYKNSIWDERKEAHRLLSQATKVLSQKTGLLSLITTNHGDIYYAGMANLLNQPEFENVESMKKFAKILDNMENSMSDFFENDKDIKICIGKENEITFPDFGFICTNINRKSGEKFFVGIIGPKRMDYERNIALINQLKELLS